MSKVKIQGNASGTGVLTVTAPNTSTDRTITLPDSTGTILDENSSLPAANLTGTVADARISALTASKLTGALPAISGAALTNLPASGITQLDQWRITTDFTGDVNPLSANWERDDTTPHGLPIGDGMSVSNGYWTFPETGKYKVEFNFMAKMDGDSRNVYGYIGTTENNSQYYDRAELSTHIQRTQSNQTLCSAHGSCIVDVTDTTNIKVKFSVFSVNTARIMLGSSTKNKTYATFTRIGDT
jgi:hypothetical protein